MQNERVKDYFVEDIQKELEEERWQLVIQARYGDGLLIEATSELFTYDEANRLTEVFNRNNVRPPLWEAQFDMAQ